MIRAGPGRRRRREAGDVRVAVHALTVSPGRFGASRNGAGRPVDTAGAEVKGVVTASRTRAAAIALTVTAALGAAAVCGVATAAKAKPPATRTVSASGDGPALNVATSALPPAGVKLVLSNKASIRHSIAISGKGIATKKGKVVGKGGTSTVTITLAAGKYTYFCHVEGHPQAGMKGTLTVTKKR